MISVYLLLDYARHEHCLTGARPTCQPNGWHTGAQGKGVNGWHTGANVLLPCVHTDIYKGTLYMYIYAG